VAFADFAQDLVPTYSPTYEDLKVLAAKGLIRHRLLNTRPLAREQIAEILAEGLRERGDDLLADPVGMRVVGGFSEELEQLGFDVPVTRHRHFWRAELACRDAISEPSGTASSQRDISKLQVTPYVWVRVDNVEPIYFEHLADRRGGLKGSFSTGEGVAILHADLVVGNHSDEPRGIPEFGTQNALIEGEDLNSWLHRGYARVSTKLVDAEYGRDWIRWGPGRTGVLGVGDAAPALNIFTLRKRMQKVDLTTYVAALDFADEQMVAGHRVEVLATPCLSLGVAEQVRFRTVQQIPIYLLAFYPYSIVEKVIGGDSADRESP